MRTQTPIFVLKRRAKALSHSSNIPHHAALDQIAQSQGYQRWSLLLQHRSKLTSSADLYSQLGRGELLLLGARPGQGKTLKSIELLYSALQEKRQAWFFTLEYNLTDLLDRTRAINIDPATIGDGFHFDNSDEICADYIAKQLKDAPRGSFVVIDFLQLLDQNRRHKPLQQQVSDLKTLAVKQALTIVMISQIDRRFELSRRDFPTLADLRLPNPVDTSLFDKWCFMNNGAYTLQASNHPLV